ncbi:MAG: hopanoid biosynthesis-associated protein HpnK [Hyphomicrobiales bacterium]|nr:hopanoid biosynthesis-associated protein HpnK [Hyphomicrobiales bacterium]MBV8439777.1 hopanoid biosynthesis-associated protein HpnK [Hyphomicrobiales bacterium]
MKRLVVTADDFGLAPEVNESVERAHRHGVLSAASLMVGAPAAADAVARARLMPRLRVGLHLVLVDGRAVAPCEDIRDLVDGSGRLRTDLAAYGLAIMIRPAVRRQLRTEIRAQFEAFHATGLSLDHVNAHQHYHLHPAIMTELLDIGRDYGMNALRVPFEPRALLCAVEPTRRSVVARLAAPWAALARTRARAAGLIVADRVFGLAWSGALSETRLAGLIAGLPTGRTEIYTHPATAQEFPGSAAGYRYREEFSALLSPISRDNLRHSGAALGGYRDFVGVN